MLSDAGTPERTQLTQAWRGRARALDTAGAAHGAVGAGAAAGVIRARVMLAKLDAPDAPLPPALLDEARQAVAKIDAATTDPYPRQAAVNAAANLYWEAGLDDGGQPLADRGTAEIQVAVLLHARPRRPRRKGRPQAGGACSGWHALTTGAKGPATRFQWGYNYLVGLLEMTPENVRGIEQAGLSVLGELDGSPDAFYQRTRMRLEQLDAKLLDWGKTGRGGQGRRPPCARARTRSVASCREGDAGRQNCERFLNPAAHATQKA